MQKSHPEIIEIELPLLHPHPQNANIMPPATLAKLRRHIQTTGRYEPLIVRPHPQIPNAYQLINGHHRKQILQSLGHTRAACVVWPLTDAETLLLLATVNRLSGNDAPTKRLDLLDALSKTTNRDAHDLALLLPEDEATLGKLLADEPLPPIAPAPDLQEMPEAFTIFLKSAEKKRLQLALAQTHPNPALALLLWLPTHEHPHQNP